LDPRIDQLQKKIDVYFKQPELLRTAVTHPSYLAEHPDEKQHNQRLEFLGDAILGAAVAYYLYNNFPDAAEGSLTKIRAAVVCEPSLANLAQKIGLGEHLQLGRGEDLSGGRKRPSILADAFEALTAAIYLDQGWEKTCDFLWKHFREEIEKAVQGVSRDYKSMLQELVQRNGREKVTYRLLSESGPDHDKLFISGVFIDNRMLGKGSGKSKKESEQRAAQAAVELLREKDVERDISLTQSLIKKEFM
jgi:ribonuclease-3